MGRAMVARLGLGLLLLALLLPTQIYSDSSTVTAASTTASSSNATTSSNSTTATSATATTATTKASDGALQSTASLLVISFSLLHLYC